MNWYDLHFIRPEWLWGLLPVLVLTWLMLKQQKQQGMWSQVIEAKFLNVLSVSQGQPASRWPVFLLLLSWIICLFALAGPSWDKQQSPVYRLQNARIIVLDLSQSMQANDVKPDRISQARFKLLDILARSREGQTGLIAYAGAAHIVSPLTDDSATIASLVPALSNDIMPTQGSRLDLALQQADLLLQQAGVKNGEIIILTDGNDNYDKVLNQIDLLQLKGRKIYILGIGTAQGGPITLANGNLAKDSQGNIIVSRLRAEALQKLATNGHGRYVQLSSDDSDLDQLIQPLEMSSDNKDSEKNQETELWQERGQWLVLLLLPLAALGFRKGWVLIVILMVQVPSQPSMAFEWQDLWSKPDQRGSEAMAKDQHEQAALQFTDPNWQANAFYQAGDYAAAGEILSQQKHADGLYNHGNALAKQGDLEAAQQAYKDALALQQDMPDAQHNFDLVTKLLEQQQEQEQEQEQESKDGESDQSEDGESKQDESKDGESQESKDGESQDGEPKEGEQGQQSEQSESEQSEQQSQSGQPSDQEADDEQQQASKGEESDQELSDKQAQQLLEQEQQQEQEGEEEQMTEQQQAQQQAEQQDQPPKVINLDNNQSDQLPSEEKQALQQWLRRIPDDPGGLLREKFRRQYLRQNDSRYRR